MPEWLTPSPLPVFVRFSAAAEHGREVSDPLLIIIAWADGHMPGTLRRRASGE